MSLLPNLFGDIRRRFRRAATISAVPIGFQLLLSPVDGAPLLFANDLAPWMGVAA